MTNMSSLSDAFFDSVLFDCLSGCISWSRWTSSAVQLHLLVLAPHTQQTRKHTELRAEHQTDGNSGVGLHVFVIVFISLTCLCDICCVFHRHRSLTSGGTVLEVLQSSGSTWRPDGSQRLSPLQRGNQAHVGGLCVFCRHETLFFSPSCACDMK